MKKRLLCLLLIFTMAVSMIPGPALAGEPNGTPGFGDVAPSDWFYNPIMYAVENNIFSGTDMDTFSPYDPMTRAMYVTVMGRIAGIGGSYSRLEGLFADVKSNAYYAPYVMWAVEKGITQGMGNNQFNPDSLITREQMATFTVRFFDAYGITYPASTSKKAPGDFGQIADYAQDAVMKLWNSGLLMGDDQGNFNPRNNATRAEAATFSGRIYTTAADFRDSIPIPEEDIQTPQENTTPQPNNNTGGSQKYYNITYITNGGGEIQTKRLPRGSALRDLPTPYKGNEIFSGWYYDAKLENRVLKSDVISKDLTLYAKYSAAAPLVETETPSFASALDQGRDFSITVVASVFMTTDQVKDAITAKNISSPDQTGFIQVAGDGITFEISGINGFEAGATYKLTLEDQRLCFQGTETSVRNYNFTIAKEDVMNLTLSQDMIYISINEVSNITEDGESIRSLSTPLMRMNNESNPGLADLTEGTFTYSGILQVGDTVTIYEGIRPDQRLLDDTRPGADGMIAYLTITQVNGNTYSYQSADAQSVLFKPDVLPIPNTADTDGNPHNHSLTVNEAVMQFSDDKYSPLQLDSQTTVDVGDYLAFYEGEFSANLHLIGYAYITSVSHEDGVMVITYTDATLDEIISSMDMYNTDPLDGETILENVDIAKMESNIEQQARDSGFAEEAAMHLADLALKTDSFTKLSEDLELTEFHLLSEDGKPIAPEQVRLMASGSDVEVELIKLDAKLSTQLKHFDTTGVGLTLDVGVRIRISTGDDSEIVITITGSFEEEVRIDVNVDGGAVMMWMWGIPFIREYEATANLDLFNYTGININASMVTKQKVNNQWIENKELQNISNELKKLLDEKEKYIGDGKGTVADGLNDKYRAMLATESDWVNLFEQEIFSYDYNIPPIFIIAIGIEVDFVVSADLNISLGCEFYYENAKRYSYTIQVFAGKVTSDVIDIVEEHYEFTFYVMGTMGLRAGIKAEIYVALFSSEFASVGFSAEVGAYIRIYGYFYYRLEYTASTGRSSACAGALYFELGIYLEVKFNAQAIGGTLSYTPTLYANEWPLWSAGMRENVQDFAYEDTGGLALKKHIRTLNVPDQAFSMTYMDLKTGHVASKAFDDAKYFTIEITNQAFAYDPITNILSVLPDEQKPVEEGEMIITWAGAPLAFTSAPISRTLSLYWDNLNNGYTIIFNPNGGSAVPMILARYNAPITAPLPPAKSGYEFAGWYTDNTFTTPYVIPATMPNTDTMAYAKWVPRNDTPYTVEHYQQNCVNNLYTIVDSDTQRLSGATDSVVTPAPKAYAGFDTPPAQNLTVLADGSGVIKYYYPRKSYVLTFDPGQAGGEPTAYQYKFGQTITAPQINNVGFTFVAWDKVVPETMPAQHLTFIAQWSPAKDTPYRVEHYIQNTSATGYTLSQIEPKSGPTNEALRISDFAMTLEGITFEKSTVDGQIAANTVIKGNGTLVVKLYYTRNVHTAHYVVENGSNTEVTYSYGQIIAQPATPVKDGYTFSGWKTNLNLTEEFTFGKAMPDQEINVYGALIPNQDTRFLVEHYYQNTTGAGYHLNQVEEKTGTTDENLNLQNLAIATEGISFEKSTVDGTTVASTPIKGDGSLVVKIYYTRNEYTVTWQNKNAEKSEVTYRFGQDIVSPLVPARDGYTFSGWKSNGELTEEFSLTTMPSRNITVYGEYIPNPNTPYRVEHYQQNVILSGYTLVDADNLQGVTDTPTTAAAKNYTGFTPKTFNQGSIAGDGKTVIRIEYDRHIYNIDLDTAGGKINSGNVTSYTYGVGAQLPTDITRAGYIFNGWFDQVSQVTNISATETGDKSYAVQWSPATNTPYTVKHVREDLDGQYTMEEIEAQQGTTDTDTAALDRDYTGFTAQGFRQSNIAGDGSTVVEILYARNSYSLSWHLDNGSLGGDYTQGHVKFGVPIIAPKVEKDGYTFSGWYRDAQLQNFYIIPLVMPAEDIDVYGRLTANSGIAYKVQHYLQNADDEGYTLKETENHTGYTDEEVTATQKSFDYFYFNDDAHGTLLSGKIKADGSLALKLYYDRETFTVDYLVDGEPYGEQARYKYGETVAYPDAPEKEGYNFDAWQLDGQSFTGSMPGENIILTVAWSAGEKSYTIRYILERVSFTGDQDRWELMTEDSAAKSGTFDETITVSPENDYVGFLTPGEQEVTLNSSLSTVDFYYNRNSYHLTWKLNGGTPNNDYTESGEVRFGTPLMAPMLTKAGYSYSWDKEIAPTMPDEDLEYTANWTANSYTVRFSEDGLANITVTYGHLYGDLPTVNKRGHTFDGWYTSAVGGEKIESASEVAIPGDHVLYAHWTVNSYILDWDLKGGTASNSYTKGSVPYGTAIIAPLPSKTGYDWAGWDQEVESTMPDANLSYTANWMPQSYTVSFNEGGFGNITVTYDGTYGLLPVPSKTGYIFDGWFTDPNQGEKITAGVVVNITSDQRLYAHWTAEVYTLTWDLSGGAAPGGYTNGSVAYGTYIDPPVPTKAGYNFSGWDREVLSHMPAENLNYVANWTPQTYKVTLNPNSGTINNGNIATYTYGVGALLPVDVTRPGYTFEGWFDQDTQVERILTTDSGNKSYTAKWRVNTYLLTYHNMDGAANHENNAPQYTFGIGLTLGNPTKTGYDFLGWFKDSAFINSISAISSSDTGDIDLYAKWTAKVYKVELNTDGGTLIAGSDITSYTYGSAVVLPTSARISKDGYTFVGWSDEDIIVTEIPPNSTGDKSYSAIWSIVTYGIAYQLNGGVNSADNPDSYSITSGDIHLAAPQKPGYVFLGWYRDQALVTPAGSPAINQGSTGSVTFYAKWRAISYTVVFHANLGSGTMPSQTFVVGEEKALSSNTFTYEGYSFAGWATSFNGNKAYDDGATVINLTTTDGGRVDLYALWTTIAYTITYHLDGGTNNAANPASYTVKSNGITLKDPTRAGGYVFAGWYQNPDFSGNKVTQIAAGSTGNLTLYALWKHYGVFNVAASGNTFTITRSGGLDGTQTVYYRTQNGSAIGGTHFTHVDGSITFNQGETSKNITIGENSVSSAYGGKAATKYANNDRVYFFDICKVQGGGTLGSSTRATRTMAKDPGFTANSSALNDYKLLASVSNKNQVIYEGYDWSYKTTVPIGLSSPVLVNSQYSANLQTYICNTASAMKVRLVDFYGNDGGWIMHRFVLFNNHTGNASFDTDKTTTVPNLPKGTKSALVYGISDIGDNTDNYGVNLPANKGLVTASGTTRSVSIHDIKWAGGQDGGNYVLYGFDETCGITVGTYNAAWQISSWTFNSASLYAAPKDEKEPTWIDVAPMANSTFNDGDQVVIALVFDEIVNSANNVSITTTLSNNPFTLTGGIGTNVLYFAGTVSGSNTAPTKEMIIINNSENIKDMCN